MKKLFSLTLVLLLLVALAVPALAAGGSVSLSASATSLKRGDTFTVTASLSGADAVAMGTVKLSYDSAALELTGGSCHVSGATLGQVIPGQNAGTFMLSGEPKKISGKIFTFNFRVKDGAAIGSYTISSSASVGVDTGSAIGSGSVKISVTCPHSFGSYTSLDERQHGRVCTLCGTQETADHSWNNGTVTTQPTCKDSGVKTYTCTVCQATRTETVDKTDKHTFGSLSAVDDINHKDTCSVCKQEVTQPHTWNKGTVNKPATCKEAGEKTLTCTGCNHTKTEVVPKTDDHSFGTWSKVSDAEHTHTCTVCSLTETADHTWNKGTDTKKATCKEEGEKTFTCTGCGATKTEVVLKSEKHTFSAWKKTADNEHKRTCSVCQLEETGTHNYKTTWSKNAKEHWHECAQCKDKKDTKKHDAGPEPTETEPQTCKTCKYILKPALGHTHNYATEWTVDEEGHWYTCAGCEEPGSYAAHDFENGCDPECSICGFTREAGHSYGEEFLTDGESHWRTCSGCGEKADAAAHIPGAEATATTAQTCTVCGYELAPALGEPEAQETGKFNPLWIILPAALAAIAIPVVIVAVKKKK